MQSKKEFKINEYINLKLEGKLTFIYVKDKKFINCKRLLIDININNSEIIDEIKSIDEVSNLNQHYLINNYLYKKENNRIIPSNYSHEISPEMEFWGHCSNLHAWIEHNYNTCLLHSNLAFPLLKVLTELGDPIAKKVFKEEIAKRITSGFYPTIKYLILEWYFLCLNIEELICVMENCKQNLKPHLYYEIISDITKMWLKYVLQCKEPIKGLDEKNHHLETILKFFSWLFDDPKLNEDYSYFQARWRYSLSNDLISLFRDFNEVCLLLCFRYEKEGSYDKLLQHCNYILSKNVESTYPWRYLSIAYQNKGLIIHAKSADRVYNMIEKLEYKRVHKLHRKIRIQQFFYGSFIWPLKYILIRISHMITRIKEKDLLENQTEINY